LLVMVGLLKSIEVPSGTVIAEDNDNVGEFIPMTVTRLLMF